MSRLGFFDIANRYAGLDAKNDPLVKLVRAKARIGLKNLTYNMRRLVQLERLAENRNPPIFIAVLFFR